jgi:SNARE protein
LERSRRTIEQTAEVGRETSGKLKAQTEQLGRIGDDLDKIETTLKRADRELRAFIRRMATDKVIMCFMMLIVLGICAIIIYQIVNKSK